MLLKDVRIQDYRSVEDSGVVPIDINVTCLVGKNESGKTAFLQALHLLNPLNPIKARPSTTRSWTTRGHVVDVL